MLVLHRPSGARAGAEPPTGEIVAEVSRLAAEGVREVTLLGQNVNSWGRDLVPDLRTEFGELLRAVDAVEGIERIRFTSPHPKDFRKPVIEAMAECAAVASTRTCRSSPARAASSSACAAPTAASGTWRWPSGFAERFQTWRLTTDIIVGFPGETEDDFRETLEVVEEVRYDGAFTFVYSPRGGTEAAACPTRCPRTSSASGSSD